MTDNLHLFNTEDAKVYGVVPAIILYDIRIYIRGKISRDESRHKIKDGELAGQERHWIFDSINSISSRHPYLTKSEVRRSMEKLLAEGVLVRGYFNQTPYDRTSWWALKDEPIVEKEKSSMILDVSDLTNGCAEFDKSNCQDCQIELSEMTNPIAESDKSYKGTIEPYRTTIEPYREDFVELPKWNLIKLTQGEVDKIKTKFAESNMGRDDIHFALTQFQCWAEENPAKFKKRGSKTGSHYFCIIDWPMRKAMEQKAAKLRLEREANYLAKSEKGNYDDDE
jgi:hypothetical protein